MIQLRKRIDEIEQNIYESLGISDSNFFKLKAKRPIYVGYNSLIKVNAAVGVSDAADVDTEYEKIDKLCKLSYRPDIVSDLSICQVKYPLYKYLIDNFDGAVGTVPYYALFSDSKGIDKVQLLETVEKQLSEGVSFMTLHLTAARELYELTEKRKIRITSRGGYCILKDQIINGRSNNVLADNIDQIIELFKKYNATVSIGSVFRPATIWDAMDAAEIKEIELQKQYLQLFRKNGINTILEGLGHASLNKITEYLNKVSDIEVPLMPLGPLPSDELIGFDHIGNALGILYMAQSPWLSIINAVTRKEHLGGIPSIDDSIEAIKTARAVAHIINCKRYPEYMLNTELSGANRADKSSCVVEGGLFENTDETVCLRCGRECPYKDI